MPRDISYSNGNTVKNAVLVVWDDSGNERPGYFRVFWSDSPNGTTGSPAIGYCSPGGSHRTIRAAVAEIRKLYPNEPVYRNGKLCR